MEKKKKKTLLKYLLLAGLLLFVGIHYRSFLADALKEIRGLSWQQIFLVILLSLGYQLLEGAIIWLLMKKYVPGYSYFKGARCAFVCSFFRFATLGSGGMAAQIVELSKDGAEYGRAGGMSMVQYLLHKVMITVYGILGFFYLLLFTDSGVKDYRSFLWLGTAMTGVIAAFLILICTSRRFAGFCFWIAKKICKDRWQDKLSEAHKQIDMLQEEAKSLLKGAGKDSGGRIKERSHILLWIVLLDLAKLTCWYLVPAAVLQGKADAAELVALTAAAQMLAGVIPAPAGIGSLEFVFLLFSTKVMGESEAISAMLLLRAAINLIPFVPGMLFSVMKLPCQGQEK